MTATICPKCRAEITPVADGPDLMCPRCKLVLPDMPRRIGRPPLPPEQRTEPTPVRTLRLSDAHWAELQARGGVAALRRWLIRASRDRPRSGPA